MNRDSGWRVRRRALVVEDDADGRELYAWCLRAAGWLVECAADGREALVLAQQFVPDVILMDMRLPVLDGIETTRQLRMRPETMAVPIVMCTADCVAANETLAREAGCDGFVRKPCTPEALLALIEGLVGAERVAG